ncbi:hypothetical protein NKW43_13590 [Gluconobacter albidus]|uniref:hypothetical protein n=1 Tax=Gluconobacter albidus TaxID=318683 RepID=UPI0020A033D9|nr:hypothetical protein [Gluconobacter albidus]MCP1274699.1 hypothetical protein [Gluconobacter albidus]
MKQLSKPGGSLNPPNVPISNYIRRETESFGMTVLAPTHPGFVLSDVTRIDDNGNLRVDNIHHGGVFYGPYISAKAGIYKIFVDAEAVDGSLYCDVYAGGCTYAGREFKNPLTFYVHIPDTERLEFRLSARNTTLSFRFLEISPILLDDDADFNKICDILEQMPLDCEMEILFNLADRISNVQKTSLGEGIKQSLVDSTFKNRLNSWRRHYEIINSSHYSPSRHTDENEFSYDESLEFSRNLKLTRVNLRAQYDRPVTDEGLGILRDHGYNTEIIAATAAYRDPNFPPHAWQQRSPSTSVKERSLVTEALCRVDLGFQDALAVGAGITAFCPISGEKLTSRHGFAHHFNASIQTFYRFDGVETFYLATGAYPNSRMFVFFPKTGVYVDFEDQGIRWYNYETLIHEFIAELVSCHQEVATFLRNEAPPRAAIFGLSNIGHFFWNEMGGLDHALESRSIEGIESIITVPSQFIDYKKLFPELGKLKHIDITSARSVFKTVLSSGYSPVHFTSGSITNSLFDRMRKTTLKYSSIPNPTSRPLIWINVRSGNKIWLNQIEGYANILNELQKEYGHVSAIIQGMNDCQEIYDGICNLAHENIQIFNGLNLSIFEKFAWASQSDAFICVAGAGMTFLVWFADVPGVAHSEHAHLDHVPWWLDARPNALPVFTPDKSQIEEVGSGWYCNYNVDWKILLDLLRKALQIRRERSGRALL